MESRNDYRTQKERNEMQQSKELEKGIHELQDRIEAALDCRGKESVVQEDKTTTIEENILIRDDNTAVSELIPLIDVKWILDVNWLTLLDLVISGEFEVCDVTGQTIDRFNITGDRCGTGGPIDDREIREDLSGLFVFESELDRFIYLVNSFR